MVVLLKMQQCNLIQNEQTKAMNTQTTIAYMTDLSNPKRRRRAGFITGSLVFILAVQLLRRLVS